MNIVPQTQAIAQMFNTDSEQFVIPAYQRRYSWRAKQVKELFDDIYHLESGESHLLGSIVCLTSSQKDGIYELELVDGQQRTTTIMLFLNAIEERLKEEGKDDDAKDMGRYLVCKDHNDTVRNKLKLGDLDNRDFSAVMENQDLSKLENKNLLEAHELIMGLVNNLSSEDLRTFKRKFINEAKIIRLDVSEAKDAFKLFETINNRGLALSPADIIKNFLLGNASLISTEILESVKADWTGLVKALDGVNMDDFFRQYIIGLLGRKISTTLLIDTFKRYYAQNVVEGELLRTYTEYAAMDEDVVSDHKITITSFVANLRAASEVYAKIVGGKGASFEDSTLDKHMENLRKIRSIASYPFVLNLMQRKIDPASKSEILWMLEVFMLRRNIAEYRTGELEDIIAKLTKLDDGSLIEGVRAAVQSNLPGDLEFKSKLIEYKFKGQAENRAKYMLEKLEDYILKRKGRSIDEKVINGPSAVHLEHIMPQTIDTKKSQEEYGDWISYLGESAIELHKEYVARLGNLTLLGASLNIRASNNPFRSKKNEGIEDDKNKQTDYRRSTIELTRELLELDDFRFKEIDDRTRVLAGMAVEIWSI